MNIALCFSGQPREISTTYQALKRHILKPLSKYNLFAFLHLPSDCEVPDIGLASSLVLQEDESLICPPPCRVPNDGVVSRPWHNGNSYRSFYLQLRSIFRSIEMSKTYAIANSIEFDWVIRLRYDNLYFGPLIEDLASLDPNAIYIPNHDNWGGYNDRFAFGSPECMNTYTKRYDYFALRQESGLNVGPEPFLKWVLENDRITVLRTRVCHHLYRHGELWMAHYIPRYGDTEPSSTFLARRLQHLFRRVFPKWLIQFCIVNRARLPV